MTNKDDGQHHAAEEDKDECERCAECIVEPRVPDLLGPEPRQLHPVGQLGNEVRLADPRPAPQHHIPHQKHRRARAPVMHKVQNRRVHDEIDNAVDDQVGECQVTQQRLARAHAAPELQRERVRLPVQEAHWCDA